MGMHIHADTSEVDGELRRLGDGPDIDDLLRFEFILDAQFKATQAAVHIITRSLKNSGKHDGEYRNNTWRGKISYGGPSLTAAGKGSTHNPVRYAQAERARGGDHDFILPAREMSPEYREAVLSFLRGRTA